jgi:hypothetical protein
VVGVGREPLELVAHSDSSPKAGAGARGARGTGADGAGELAGDASLELVDVAADSPETNAARHFCAAVLSASA